MIPAVSPAGAATGQPVTPQTTTRAVMPQAPEAARASIGETPTSLTNIVTSKAVTAPDQTAVAPRLRDQETSERTDRAQQAKDAPTGPPPSFEESPLERQARVAFDPPEPSNEPAFRIETDVVAPEGSASEDDRSKEDSKADSASLDPPPTPTERAEASFAETRSLATTKESASVDVEL